MPWHLSRSDPRKVYDPYHNAVCVCQNADQARLIVDAVNAHGRSGDQSIKLREPAPAEKEAAQETQHSTSRAASGDESRPPVIPLQPDTWMHDECCTKHLARALQGGMLAHSEHWLCPKCGTEWKVEMRGPVRYWEPVTAIEIIRL